MYAALREKPVKLEEKYNKLHVKFDKMETKISINNQVVRQTLEWVDKKIDVLNEKFNSINIEAISSWQS